MRDVGLGLVVVVVGEKYSTEFFGKNSRNSLQSWAAMSGKNSLNSW